MRNLLVIVVILFSLKSLGQQKLYNIKIDSCYILNNDTISGDFTKITIQNGYVEQYVRVKFDTKKELIIKEGFQPFQSHIRFIPLAEGKIENGERTRHWLIFNRNCLTSEFSFSCRVTSAYKVHYQKDTVTYIKEGLFRRRKIQYVNDSLLIFGELSSPESSVYFKCDDECLFYERKSNKIVLRGKREDLDWLLWIVENDIL